MYAFALAAFFLLGSAEPADFEEMEEEEEEEEEEEVTRYVIFVDVQISYSLVLAFFCFRVDTSLFLFFFQGIAVIFFCASAVISCCDDLSDSSSNFKSNAISIK